MILGGDDSMEPNKSREEEFYKWLSGRVSPKQLSGCYSIFNTINRHYQLNGYLKTNIFEVNDIAVLQSVRNDISTGKAFKRRYPGRQVIANLGMLHYIAYVEECISTVKEEHVAEKKSDLNNSALNSKDSESVTVIEDNADLRDEFSIWLQKNNCGVDAISIIQNLSTIERLLMKNNVIKDSVYKIKNESFITSIINIVKENKIVRIGIAEKHRAYVAALEFYLEFLSQISDQNDKNKNSDRLSDTLIQSADRVSKALSSKKGIISLRTIEFLRTTDLYQNEKKQFQNWLVKEGYDKRKAILYVSAIEEGSKYALLNGLTREELFLLTSQSLSESFDGLYKNRKLCSITYFTTVLGALLRYKKLDSDNGDKEQHGEGRPELKGDPLPVVGSNISTIKVDGKSKKVDMPIATATKYQKKSNEPTEPNELHNTNYKYAVDFTKKSNYRFTRPISVSYFGDVTYESKWRGVYVYICKRLLDDYPRDFEKLRNQQGEGAYNIVCSKSVSLRFNEPVQISGDYYVDVRRNATDIVRNIKLLLDYCKVEYKNVLLCYMKTQGNEFDESDKTSSGNIEQKKRNDSSSDYLTKYLEQCGIEYIDYRYKSGCLWIIGGHEITDKMVFLVEKGVKLSFRADGSKATSGRAAWWTRDKLTLPVEQSQSENKKRDGLASLQRGSNKKAKVTEGRNAFIKWMETYHSNDSIPFISWTLSKVSDIAISEKISEFHLYTISDIEELSRIIDLLQKNESFIQYNSKNSTAEYAVQRYYEFRGGQDKNRIQTKKDLPNENSNAGVKKDKVEENRKNVIEPVNLSERKGNSVQLNTEDSTKEAVINTNQVDKGNLHGGMESELYEMLKDDQLEALRSLLVSKGVLKMRDFEDLNLWVFMNQNGLYSINKRYAIYNLLRKQIENKKQASQDYILKTQQASYVGATPAEVFLHYCENLSRKAPLKFRSLIGKKDNESGNPIIKRESTVTEDLLLRNPTGYIDSTIDVDTALRYARYACIVCRDLLDPPISIEENRIEPSIEESKQTMVQASSSGTVDKEKTEMEGVKYAVEGSTNLESVGLSEKDSQNEIVEISSGLSEEAETTKGTSHVKDIIKNWTEDKKEETKESVEPIIPQEQKVQSYPEVRRTSKVQTKIEEYILDADIDGVTLGKLYRRFPSISMVVLRQICENSEKIVDLQDKLVHVDAFIDLDEAADDLHQILEKLLNKNDGYVSASQLYDYVHADMQMFLNDNDVDDELSVYCIARHLFSRVKWKGVQYVFTANNHISRSGRDALYTNMDVIRKFARDRGGFFEYDDLINYLEQVGIKTGNMRGQMQIGSKPEFMYYSSKEIITKESMNINGDWLKRAEKAFERLFDDVGDHIVLRDINPIWYEQLPELPSNRSWTPLLLQYVLRFYGSQLGAKTIGTEAAQRYDTLHAMLVSNKSELQSFADTIVAYIVDNNIEQRKYETEQLRRVLLYGKMITGGELMQNLPKAIGTDPRFAWDVAGKNVTIKV